MKGTTQRLQLQLLQSYHRHGSYHNTCTCYQKSRINLQSSHRLLVRKRATLYERRVFTSNTSGTNCSSRSSSNMNDEVTVQKDLLRLMIVQYPSNTSMSTNNNQTNDNEGWNKNHHHYGTNSTLFYTGTTSSGTDTNDTTIVDHAKSSVRSLQHHPYWKQKPLVEMKQNANIDQVSTFTSSLQFMNVQQWLYRTILIHFVPVRYPSSVQQPGYTIYATYSFIAAIAGSASMVISTQILLSTMFMVTATTTTTATAGAATATAATAGALNWVMKDGIGQLGGIIVASQMGHYHAFDNNPKRYRMYSAMLLDLAAFIEICTPLLCGVFGPMIHSPTTMIVLPSACIATICKNIGYIMASASRATLHQSLCIRNINDSAPAGTFICTGKANSTTGSTTTKEKDVLEGKSVQNSPTGASNNLADVTAKFGSQGTAAGLIGTIIGISFSASTTVWHGIASVPTLSSFHPIDIQQYSSMLGFMLFVGIHQTCNYMALRSVALHHFNRQRLSIVLQNYVQQQLSPISTTGSCTESSTRNTLVLTPAMVTEREYFLPNIFYPFRTNDTCDKWLLIGCSLPYICPKGLQQFLRLQDACSNENYIINVEENGKFDRRILLVFFEQATSIDTIRGMLHAHVLQKLVFKNSHHYFTADDTDDVDSNQIFTAISKSHEHVQSLFPSFLHQLHKVGWNTQTVFVEEEPNSFRLAIKFHSN